MQMWRKVWREGFAPGISVAGLTALRDALIEDDVRLLQGMTTSPPPLVCVQDWTCKGACPVSFIGWQGDDLNTVGEVEKSFAKACFEADKRLREPGACRYFLCWVDDTPREEMRKNLLEEVELALSVM